MNSKHRKTLEAIMSKPTPKALPYRDVKSLLIGIGCDFEEREGSRVCFSMLPNAVSMHRPHPGKEIREYQIKEIKTFLQKTGFSG